MSVRAPLTVALLLLLLVVSACGGGSTTARTTTPLSTAEPTSALTQEATPSAVATPTACAKSQFYSLSFVSASQGWALGSCGVFATTDGGQQWRLMYAVDGTVGKVQFLDANTGFAVTRLGFITTTDGGQHWTLPSTGEGQPSDFQMVSATEGWAIGQAQRGATESTLFRIENRQQNGQTYQVYTKVMSPASSVCFGNAQNGWAASGTEVKRTTDGGTTWSVSFTNPLVGVGSEGWGPTLTCVGGGVVYVTYVGGAANGYELYGLFRTVDGGAHWVPVLQGQVATNLGVPAGQESLGPVAPRDAYHVIVAGACETCGGNAGTTEISTSDDAGVTWNPPVDVKDAGAFPMTLDFIDADHGWLTTLSGIFGTTDGGQTWMRETLP